ncbi:uncharacterized protein LOC128137960, partial [Harpia harpyja]|uniref:uncharacterized protein LOC128137960 n=1 Tax=Harpia harpyja TaxID=202280 RepID=UPI0022B0D7CF
FQSAAEPARSSTLCHLHRCGWDRAVLHIPKATKSHPCPCCFAGSFCGASDVLGADLLDCSYSMPDRQLVRRVVSQVEFYLSDENLAKDAFLLKHVQKNKMGFVSVKLLTFLKKVEYLTHDWWLTLYALQFSELLEVNEEGTKVRRWVIAYVHTFCMVRLNHCALVQYKSLGSASALRSLEDLGRQSCPRGESISVVRLCGKGSEKTPGAEREVADELVDQPGWKAQAVAVTFPDGLGDSLLCSSPERNGAQALPPLLLHKDPSAPSWPGSNFKPSNFGNAFTGLLLASKVFPPLGTGLGTGSCYGLCSSTESTRGCGWGSGVDAWAPWPSSPSPDAKPLAGNPPAATWVPEPLGLRDAVLCLPHCCPKSGVVYLETVSSRINPRLLPVLSQSLLTSAFGTGDRSYLPQTPPTLPSQRGGDGLTDSGGAGVSPPLQALGDGIASPSAAPSFPRQKKRTDTRPWGLPPLNRSALPQLGASRSAVTSADNTAPVPRAQSIASFCQTHYPVRRPHVATAAVTTSNTVLCVRPALCMYVLTVPQLRRGLKNDGSLQMR